LKKTRPDGDATIVKQYHLLFAPVTAHGNTYTARLVIREYADGMKFNIPELYELKKIDPASPLAPAHKQVMVDASSISKASIKTCWLESRMR
jgi:hypothetical protein